MKKVWFSIALLSALLLTGCSNNGKTSDKSSSSESQSSSTSSSNSSSSSSSSEASSSSSSSVENTSKSSSSEAPKAQKMDLNQISQGDYSSIAGTWKNNEGKVFVISQSTISLDGKVIKFSEQKFNSGVFVVNAHAEGEASGFSIIFASIGTKISASDVSDTSKERLWAGQDSPDNADAFYKVN